MTTETKPLDIPSVGEQIEINRTINERIKATRIMPSQGEDNNNGVYITPLNFLEPVNRRWNLIFDLAANKENNVVERLNDWPGCFYDESDDALSKSWAEEFTPSNGLFWLNPPFSEIKKWVAKAAYEASKGVRIVMLLPDSTGSDWYTRFVKPNAVTYHLIGRITFEFRHTKDAKPDKHGKKRYLIGDQNTDPFPKDCMLCVFDNGMEGQVWWDWRKG